MRRILLIMPNWIGDCLLASPSLRAIREADPEAFVVVLVHPRVREVFEDNPFLDVLLDFAGKKNFFKILIKLSVLKLDTAFLFKPSLTRSLLCKLSGIKEIVGYESKKITFINRRVPLSEKPLHKMDYYLNLLEKVGLKVNKRIGDFFLQECYLNKAKSLLRDTGSKKFRIVIHPKANWDLKMWPLHYYAELADRLIEGLGAEILITGSFQDRDLALSISRLMKNKATILAGKTSIKELAGLLTLVDLFISSDTGIMHLASSLGVPLIALFGPTHPLISGPRGKSFQKVIHKDIGCSLPCYNLNCRDNICMKKITPQEVYEEAKKFLLERDL